MMKVLIGTPVHESKDYGLKQWLKSVSEIEVPSSCQWLLYMVDNSPGSHYQDTIRKYCSEIGFTNYELTNLADLPDGEDGAKERLGVSREAIRQKLLAQDWDFWFSWECDIICPPNILSVLLRYTADFDVVGHTYPLRSVEPTRYTDAYKELESMGLLLLPKRLFIDYGFMEGVRHHPSDVPLINEIIKHGWKWASLHNYLVIDHLTD